MALSLMDVSAAIATCKASTFKVLRCYVVNYTAGNEFPQKFWYNGCSVQRGNGNYCAKSSCEHARSKTRPMYRFQLQLTDDSPFAPVIVTIFDQAATLLGIPAEQFCTLSPESQLSLVREKTSKMTNVHCKLKVKEDFYSGEYVAIVQLLYCRDKEDDALLEMLADARANASPSPGLPRVSREYHTPQGCEESTSTTPQGDSTVSRRRAARAKSSQLSNVKTKLQDLIDVIDLKSIDD